MGVMSLKDMIIDSLRYSVSNWKSVLFLGVVLLLADITDELSGTGDMAGELRLILISLVFLLAVLEAGYVFRILIETINGSTKLPHINNFKIMFRHGIQELIILGVYFSVPIILFGIFFLNFMLSMDLNDVSGESLALFLLFIAILFLVYIFFPAVLLHRAHHDGDLRSGFDFRKIYHKIQSVGVKRLIVVYIGILLLVSLVEAVLSDSIATNIPLIGELISDLIIAPLVLIFSTRFLGLIDQ